MITATEHNFEKILWTLLQYRKFFEGEVMQVYADEALKALSEIEWEFIRSKLVENTSYETMARKRHPIDIKDVLRITSNAPTLLLPVTKFNDPNSF